MEGRGGKRFFKNKNKNVPEQERFLSKLNNKAVHSVMLLLCEVLCVLSLWSLSKVFQTGVPLI
jgi:hypothetical protein